MTALDPHQYEIYRVVTDYEALKEGFNDRINDLNVPLFEVDSTAGLTRGYSQKLLCGSHEKWARIFGPNSLERMLRATGMVLVMVIDDQRFAPVKAQLARRKKLPTNAGKVRPRWLFTKKNAREMGLKRWSLMTPAQLKRHQRKAQRAMVAARRRKSQVTYV